MAVIKHDQSNEMIKAYTCADTFLSFLNTCALFHLWITNMKLKTIKLRMLTLTLGLNAGQPSFHRTDH